MAKQLLRRLKGAKNTDEIRLWPKWLRAASRLASDWCVLKDDPFAYNEAATVSLLTAAAVKVEMLALAEFVVTKRAKLDRRKNVRGRCDLWICSKEVSWAFECKQKFYDGAAHKADTIVGWLDHAHNDAKHVAHRESDKRFGLLIISTYFVDEIEPEFIEAILDASKHADFAWALTPDSESAGITYLLLKEVQKGQARRRAPTKGSY